MAEPLLALSVQHPWALGLALGLKPVENRDWRFPPTSHVGKRIALHASKVVGMLQIQQLRDLAQAERWPPLPGLDTGEALVEEMRRTAGCILAVGTLARVIEHGDGDELNASPWRTRDRFGLVFSDVVRLRTPMPVKGALGFWQVPIYPAEQVLRQIARAA